MLPRKASLEDFWKLETIGINDSQVDPLDVEIHQSSQKMEDIMPADHGNMNTLLPENRELAYGRLKSPITKMKNNREFGKQYDNVIQDQHKFGITEKVKSGSCDSIKHYIPHHIVVNPSKTTTKVRVVYDASAKTKQENKSFNDCLYRGPVLLQDLTRIILWFRLNKVAIVADIEKGFYKLD